MYLLDKINITARTFTDEGYLIVKDARIARTGIQEYYAAELGLTDRDPSDVIKLYRPEKEVFNKASMDSFSNKPVTNNHPQELVDAKNAKELSVGYSGETIARDGIFLTAKLVVTDDEAIREIQSGKVELSNGYTSEIEFTAGVNDAGEEYDAIQTDIKGNHIAIVKMGRCGSECKISDELNEEGSAMKILIDGIEYEANDQTAQAVNKVMADAEAANKKAEDAEEEAAKEKAEKEKMEKDHKAQMDTMQAKVDDAEANKVTPELLDALIVKRSAVVDVAAKVVKDFKAEGKDCETIRKEVVQDQHKDLDLTDKSADYINARFDAIADRVGSGTSDTLKDAMVNHAHKVDDADLSDSEKARNKQMADSRDAWKKPVNAVATA